MKQPKLVKMMYHICRIILLIWHSLSSITRYRLTVQTTQLQLILSKHNKTWYVQTISYLPLFPNTWNCGIQDRTGHNHSLKCPARFFYCLKDFSERRCSVLLRFSFWNRVMLVSVFSMRLSSVTDTKCAMFTPTKSNSN